MEQLWVALLAVGTILFSSGIADASYLHGAAFGPSSYLHLLPPPHELIYTNVHSPFVLSHLHGQRIDEALAVSGFEQGQSPVQVDENLAVTDENEAERSPAPVVETSTEINKPILITQEQLYEEVFGKQAESPEGSNAIEDGVTSTRVETPVITSNVQSSIEASPNVADFLVPQTRLITSSVQSSVSPSPIAPVQEVPLQPGTILTNNQSASQVQINTAAGNIQMKASLFSGGEGLGVSVGDAPKLGSDSVPVIIPELPASDGITKGSKPPQISTNVNVNVNVNGDGKGSVIDSTSVAGVTVPIKTVHTKCD